MALCVLALAVLAAWNLPRETSSRVKGVVRDGLSPLQAVVKGSASEVREIIRYIRGLGDMMTENRTLHETLAATQTRLAVLEEAEENNRTYRELLDFRKSQPHALVAAEVIGRDSSGWWHTIRLNKGMKSRVHINRAVIAYPGGFVGRSVAVSDSTCDVLLASDPSCMVSVRVTQPGRRSGGTFGVMKGLGGQIGRAEAFMVEYLPLTEEIAAGDEVLTSGLGGVFPKGLTIGTVTRAEPDESGLFQRAWVESAVDLGNLEYVFVLQTTEDQLPPATHGLTPLEALKAGELYTPDTDDAAADLP